MLVRVQVQRVLDLLQLVQKINGGGEMFFKIVIKNMKYNIKNYILFFIGNMIGVTTFFGFWGIYSVVKSSASNSINLEDTLVDIII